MQATIFEVLDRPRDVPYRRPGLGGFRLREIGRQPAEGILRNPHITLYSLDFEPRAAVFVELPADVDLSQAAFYFDTQFEEATRVLTVPFETMIQLATSVEMDDSRLVNIYSTGRCGSTLASQVFAQIPGVVNISEPYTLSQLVIARNTGASDEGELVALLEATIRLLCKSAAETAWVVKGQSFVIELGDWWHRLYPHTRNLFLYRHAETWLRSGLRAYSSGPQPPDEEHRERERQRRQHMGSLVPPIARYDPEQPLSHAGILALMWLRAMERYVQLCESGMEMLAIRYASWLSAPRKTAEAMLDYCRCRPADMTAVYEILDRDSQAGTRLSRETLDQRGRVIAKAEMEELHRHLQGHPFINQADFEAPYTLKVG